MPNKYQPLLIGLAMITMASTLTALLRPQINWWQTLRVWMAGIVSGAVILLFCYKNNYTGVFPDVVMLSSATFIQAIYPLAEKFVKIYFQNKIEEKAGKKSSFDTKTTPNENAA